MKKAYSEIILRNDRATDIPMFRNYSHFKFAPGGIILTSNKDIGLPKVFVTFKDIALIIW